MRTRRYKLYCFSEVEEGEQMGTSNILKRASTIKRESLRNELMVLDASISNREKDEKDESQQINNAPKQESNSSQV